MKPQDRAKKMTTRDYLAVMGLGDNISPEELEARYQELSAYLSSTDIPSHLLEWAREQAALVDEAYAVLADPDRRAGIEEDEPPTPETPSRPPSSEPALQSVAVPAQEPPAGLFGWASSIAAQRPLLAVALGVFIGAAALLAVIIGRSGITGDGSQDPAGQAQQQGDIVPLDTERVAELMTSYQQDPKNLETLFELGENYFLADEWQPALDWFTKLIALDPKNVHALTDIGTAQFNLGKPDEAKATWTTAVGLAPDDAQLHYNLGFLYANSEPQDLAAALNEWQMVLQLAPGTPLAETVQLHMEGLSDAAGTPAPTGTPAPAPQSPADGAE